MADDVVRTPNEPTEEAPATGQACGATTMFWPDDEAIDAVCILPSGHQPDDVHEDETLGTWREYDLLTWRRP